MAQGKQVQPTMEHGHRVLGQYRGECGVINDPRPKVWQARGVSEEDDPRKVKVIEEILARYRKEEEE